MDETFAEAIKTVITFKKRLLFKNGSILGPQKLKNNSTTRWLRIANHFEIVDGATDACPTARLTF